MFDTIVVKEGYIYLLKNELLGGYKIGITTSPKIRFKQLAVGTKSKLIGYWEHAAYRELEKYFHKVYKEVRVPQSEWFDLQASDIQHVIDCMTTAGITQYLDPDYIGMFTPNRPVVYRQGYIPPNRSNWTYFSIAAIVCTLAFMLGSAIG